MATCHTEGISLFYETLGNPAHPPVLLISGLGGVGASWGVQIQRFAENYFVILPDQRGTGQTSRTTDGYTTLQLAKDMVHLLEHLQVEAAHVVGASTGGAIAQYMALDFPEKVLSLTLSSSFARFDEYMKREFLIRRKMAAEWDRQNRYTGYAIFLFSAKFMNEHPEKVQAWIDKIAVLPDTVLDKEIEEKRHTMVETHDTLERLKDILIPTLVLSGSHNMCTLRQSSEELAAHIPGAELVIFEDAGELIERERADDFFAAVSSFIDRN